MHPIENDHNVYILGAGFSSVGGMPVIADFMSALRDAHSWLSTQGRTREAGAVERVLDFRLRATPAAYRVQLDLENIEELFSFASIAEDALSPDISLAIAATLDFRHTTTPHRFLEFDVVSGTYFKRPQTWTWNTRDAGGHGGTGKAKDLEFYVYSMLGGLCSLKGYKGRNTLITLNYDLLLEEALSALEIPFSYGAQMKLQNDGKVLRATNDPEFDRSHGLSLLKLHGSVNWTYQQSGSDQLTVLNSYSEVLQRELTPFLVPPTWRKPVAFSLADIWVRARQQIETATRVVIIGFSIPETDQDIKYLIAAGLRENISLREVVFVNPLLDSVVYPEDARALEERLTRLFGDLGKRPRIRKVPCYAERFLSDRGFPDGVESIGRRFHESLQRLTHSTTSQP